MKINWKVRIKSKTFWVAVIPALILLIQAVTAVFGYSLDLTVIQDKLMSVVNAIFILLTALGIVVDSTTAGLSDSEQALTYTEPKSVLDEVYTDNRMDTIDSETSIVTAKEDK